MEHKVLRHPPQIITKIANTYWCLPYLKKVPSSLHILTLINHYNLRSRCYYHSHFTGGGNWVAERLRSTCRAKHLTRGRAGFQSRHSGSKVCLLNLQTFPPLSCYRVTKSDLSFKVLQKGHKLWAREIWIWISLLLLVTCDTLGKSFYLP